MRKVSNQLISLASRESDKFVLVGANAYICMVSNQLISLASREKNYESADHESLVSNQLISLASREKKLLKALKFYHVVVFPIN